MEIPESLRNNEFHVRNLGWGNLWGQIVIGHSHRADSGLQREWIRKSDVFSLNIILEGSGEYRDAEDNSFPVSPGTLIVRRAGERGLLTTPAGTPFTDAWIVVDSDSSDGLRKLHLIPQVSVLKLTLHPGITDAFLSFENLCRSHNPHPRQDPIRTVILHRRQIINELIQFITHLFEQAQRAPRSGYWAGIVHRACQCLDTTIKEPVELPALAGELGVSYTSLRRHFLAQQGMSMETYRIKRRLDLARHLLLTESVAVVADELGYCDPFTFSAQFKKHLGQSPSDFKKNLTPEIPSTAQQ